MSEESHHYYVLNDNNEIHACDDVQDWLRKGGGVRDIDKTKLLWGNMLVSTVFLGLNHQWSPDQPPLVFETMVFPSAAGDEILQWRYSSWAEAKEGHLKAVVFAKKFVRHLYWRWVLGPALLLGASVGSIIWMIATGKFV